MEIIQKARELGALLQQDDRYTAYNLAKTANDNDSELQTKINEFNMKRMQLNSEMSKADKDDAKLAEFDADIKKIYGEIMSNKNMILYNNAKNAMDAMLNQINMIITYAANGEDPMTCPTEQPSSCSGSCSTCGGCS